MSDHVWRDMPQDYRTRHRVGKATQACVVCGKWNDGTTWHGKTCEDFEKEAVAAFGAPNRWGPGGSYYPWAGTPHSLDTGFGDLLGSNIPEETRPGLAPETIDRKAFDEFMKGL